MSRSRILIAGGSEEPCARLGAWSRRVGEERVAYAVLAVPPSSSRLVLIFRLEQR